MIRAEEKATEREQSRKAGDDGKAGKQEPLGRGSKKRREGFPSLLTPGAHIASKHGHAYYAHRFGISHAQAQADAERRRTPGPVSPERAPEALLQKGAEKAQTPGFPYRSRCCGRAPSPPDMPEDPKGPCC